MTVVVGVDNSAASRAALRLAAQEARCPVTVVPVEDTDEKTSGNP